MLTTILVPTDGSDHANKAVELAADIAAKYGSRVILLHTLLSGEAATDLRHMAEVEHLLETESVGVQPMPYGNSPEAALRTAAEGRPMPPRTLELIGQQILGGAEAALRRKGVSEISLETREGDPAKCILDVAKRESASLIVMGSRGLGALKGLLLGSVSQKVNQEASCTCMTVR